MTIAELERTRTELLKAEKQFDRLQSSTVQALDAGPVRNGSQGGSSTPVGIKQSPTSPAPFVSDFGKEIEEILI